MHCFYCLTLIGLFSMPLLNATNSSGLSLPDDHVAANSDANARTECMQLPLEQRNFAMRLNPTNKMLFCTKFSTEQRNEAIRASTNTSGSSAISPDQAVEQVAKKNNILLPSDPNQPTAQTAPEATPPQDMTETQPSRRSGCPTRSGQ
jgi:hypothetical protein